MISLYLFSFPHDGLDNSGMATLTSGSPAYSESTTTRPSCYRSMSVATCVDPDILRIVDMSW